MRYEPYYNVVSQNGINSVHEKMRIRRSVADGCRGVEGEDLI